MKITLLTLLFAAQSLIAAPPASDTPVDFEFKASPRVNLNREQANKEGVSIMDINKRIQAFFEEREQFTLDELRSLEITTLDGKTIKLSQVATIEVTFLKDPTKKPAEQAAPSNGDKPSN